MLPADAVGQIALAASTPARALPIALTCRGALAAFRQACVDLRKGVIELGWMTSGGLAAWRDVMAGRRHDIDQGRPAPLGHLCTVDAINGAGITIAHHKWCLWCDMRADDHLCCEDTFDWRKPDRVIG